MSIDLEEQYDKIYRYCYYKLHHREKAEDITQETFLHFFEKLSDYRYIGKTRNYLYTIAGNLCKDYYKKKRESLLEEQSREFQNSPRQSETEDILNKITIEAALNNLPEELREVIILYYFQELKLAEIADTLQIGLPLVKYRIKQGKMRLEKMLREE